MKPFKKLLTLILLMSAFSAFAQTNSQKPFVIPELREWHGLDGSVTINKASRIVIKQSQSNELMPIAKQFAADIHTMFGIKVGIRTGTPIGGDIGLTIAPELVELNNKEAYVITADKAIQVAANEAIGVYWATRTLLQIADQSPTRSIPSGVIRDYPDYPMRGFMLDTGRKFFSMDYLQSMVKMMSYYKMNTFQIHLNDNGFKEFFEENWDKTYAAFRLESETYPGLAAKDGFYTKKEFRQLQIDALGMGVTIIPEIDAPAHTLAFAHYMPEIGSKEYGMDHLDLFNPKTYEFMDGLFKEYLEGENPVFVNQYVHIGTDEYSNKDQKVVEKFRYFTDYYIKYVESFGKKAALWGALTHAKGDTPVKVDNVLMWCWYNGYAQPRDMIAAGYDLVSAPDGLVYIVPEAGYYYDYLNIKRLYETWTPAMIGREVFDEKDPKIKGGVFAVWNDHCGNGISFQDVHHRVYPAMQTLAVKMWDGKNTTVPFEDFDKKRIAVKEAPDVNILARQKADKNGIVLFDANPKQGSVNKITDIGFNYRVAFDLTADNNENGTILFESPTSKFYIADPAEGKMGFTRDGYHYRFNYKAPISQKVTIWIEGTNKSTKLFVNGKLVESLDVVHLRDSLTRQNMKMRWVQTLVFPLAKIGNFNGTMQNLIVTQQ